MLKFLFTSSLLTSYLLSSVVVPDEYMIQEDSEVSYVFHQEHQDLIPETKHYQKEVMRTYENEFGVKLDDTLHVGIASSKNQIANAYSTQIPLNSQILYGAGVTYIDYFSINSWLKTLLIHETSHNYQLNPKENCLSKVGHKIVGNQAVSFLGFLPFFPLPNVLESSFILEGNAVMNESRFGNGGRLFSGYALAQTVSLAKAGKIKPEFMYNATLSFPYGEKFYLVGGFFHQFLVQKYGVAKVNNYFKSFAEQPFPFFTDQVFVKHYGQSFTSLLSEFVKDVKQKHQGFQITEGKTIAKSQVFVPLNRDEKEIYTLIGDRKATNRVLRLERETQKLRYQEGSWLSGELFKIEGKYYSQSSAKTSPTTIEMGLFDEDAKVLEGYERKAFQGFMDSGEKVYFDIQSSIESPQVYIDKKFYTQSHSSVHIHKNDLYYFKQEQGKRILYRNEEALLSYKGHYGFVVDVDSLGSVYFVATSKHGSTVYRWGDGVTQRVVVGDDVIDFKLLNDKKALVTLMSAEGYVYKIVRLEGQTSEVEMLLERPQTEHLQLSNRDNEEASNAHEHYHSYSELQYSALDQALYYDESTGLGLNLQANFSDPLIQNSLAFVLSHNEDRDIVGVRYANSANQLEYGGAVYGVAKKNEAKLQDKRDVGYNAYLNYPFIEQGYLHTNTTLAYNEDYNTIYRKPFTLSLDISEAKKFGLSKYFNSLHALSLFGSLDRDVNYVGGSYDFQKDFLAQTYLGFGLKYMQSSEVDFFREKGIELRDTFTALQSDRATLYVPSFSNTTYAKSLKMAEFSVSKVFDFSLYNFSLPLSLQREAFYLKQRIYDVDFTDTVQRTYYESIIGMELDLLFFHKMELPLQVEWVHNEDVIDTDKVKVYFGVGF